MCGGRQTRNRYGYCLPVFCVAGPWLASLVTENLPVPILSTSLHGENWTHMGPAGPLRRDIVLSRTCCLFSVPSDCFTLPSSSGFVSQETPSVRSLVPCSTSYSTHPPCQWPPDCGAGPPMYPANSRFPRNKWDLPQSHSHIH